MQLLEIMIVTIKNTNNVNSPELLLNDIQILNYIQKQLKLM